MWTEAYTLIRNLLKNKQNGGLSMLAAEMKKGIKCFIQGSIDLQDEKAKYIESFGVIAETPGKHAKNVLVKLAHNSGFIRVPVVNVYWIDQKINVD